MSKAKTRYLDPFVLARLANLQLRAQSIVEGFVAGLHPSPTRGHSLEFAQHREYAFGDELKYIDWKVYGRSDRFFVKQFEEETNLRVHLLLDASGSMAFQGKKSAFSKYDYGATLAASLAYLTLRQQDSVGLSCLARERAKVIPPRSSLHHLYVLLEELEAVKPGGETLLSEGLSALAHRLQKRSLVILISDLLDDPEPLFKSLKFLRFKKHEVVVLHLLDGDEYDFSYSGTIQFDSLEKPEHVVMETDSYRKEYLRMIREFIENTRVALRNSGIQYVFATTRESPDLILRQVLS